MIKQRKRSRTSSLREAVQGSFSWDNLSQLYVPSGVHTYQGCEQTTHRSSSMIDVIGGSSHQFKDCYHASTTNSHKYTESIGNELEDVTFWQGNDPLSLAVTVPVQAVYKCIPWGSVPNLVPSLEACDTLFRLRSLETDIDFYRDPVDFGFSIWFLLRDILTIPKLLADMAGFISVITYKRRFTTLSQLANLNLQYQFGVAAFLSDFRDFRSILAKWQNAYDRLRQQMDQVYTWHSKPSVVSYSDPEGLSPLREYDLGIINGLQSLTNLRASFVRGGLEIIHRRAMQYSFRCPETTSFLARACQLIDSLGLLDPVAIWDLIPFSFVADWFGDWSGWLRRNLKPKLFKVDMVVKDYCESLKLTRVSTVYVDGYATTLTHPPTDASMKRKRLTIRTDVVYRRKRFRPPESAIKMPSVKSFEDAVSPGRCRIAASLVAQRLPRGSHGASIATGV
jgi:hypothetical protein